MNPLLAGRLLLAFVIAAALAWACHLIYKAGGDARERPWLEREAKANAQAAQEIANAAKAAQAARAEADERIRVAGTTYLQENERAKAENDRLNTCLRAGTCGMRIRPAQPQGGAGAVPDTAGGKPPGDAPQGCQLPAETAVALRDLAGEADEVVRQLTLAQQEIRAIRQACQAPRP